LESKYSYKKYCNQLIPPHSTLQKDYLESIYKDMTATILAMHGSGYPVKITCLLATYQGCGVTVRVVESEGILGGVGVRVCKNVLTLTSI
jgi:hypothetical protein